MTNKLFNIEVGVFNITNLCNLSCKGCETYNDLKFKGHSYWKDHVSEYLEWSNKLDIDEIVVIGGEPFTNPDLSNWITGLSTLWPSCKNMQICTNGTYLNNHIDDTKKYLEQGFWLDISCHNPEFLEKIKSNLEHILEEYRYEVSIENTTLSYFSNGRLLARLYTAYNFRKTSRRTIKNGVIYMHDSNIEKAHDLCIGGQGQCYTFFKGNLYKCYLTAISNDLMSQFKLEDRAVDLLSKYQPCSPWNNNDQIDIFLKNLDKAIPQCTLCPEKETIFPIWPTNKKK